MIKLTITMQAYQAIVDSLPPDSKTKTPQRGPNGHMYIWLDAADAKALMKLCRKGEDVSDTIIRLAGAEG